MTVPHLFNPLIFKTFIDLNTAIVIDPLLYYQVDPNLWDCPIMIGLTENKERNRHWFVTWTFNSDLLYYFINEVLEKFLEKLIAAKLLKSHIYIFQNITTYGTVNCYLYLAFTKKRRYKSILRDIYSIFANEGVGIPQYKKILNLTIYPRRFSISTFEVFTVFDSKIEQDGFFNFESRRIPIKRIF